MIQPHVSQQLIVPLLVQEQLMMAAECRVGLAMFVEIGRVGEASVTVVQEEHHAFPYVDEQTYVQAASTGQMVSACHNSETTRFSRGRTYFSIC